jgi:hypothetical protein
METEITKTVWELFRQTGEIGYYNLFAALENDNNSLDK